MRTVSTRRLSGDHDEASERESTSARGARALRHRDDIPLEPMREDRANDGLAPLSATTVMRLQASAGNRAVRSVLQGRRTTSTPRNDVSGEEPIPENPPAPERDGTGAAGTSAARHPAPPQPPGSSPTSEAPAPEARATLERHAPPDMPSAAQAIAAAAAQPPARPEPLPAGKLAVPGAPHGGDHAPPPLQRTARAHSGRRHAPTRPAQRAEIPGAVDGHAGSGPPATATALEHHAAQPSARPAVPQANFRETDVSTLLPEPAQDEAPEEREQLVASLTEEMAAERTAANAAVDAFVAQRREQAKELDSLKPGLTASIRQAAASAEASIDSTATTKIGEVRGAVRSARAQARTRAQQLRGHIEGEHLSTQAAIQAATDATRTALQGALTSSQTQVTTAQAAQLTHLGGLYDQAAGQFRAAAQSAAALATTNAGRRAASYRAGKINRDDSFWDGPLTDNRCDAQAEAAEKVGEAYRDGLVKEGDKQVTTLQGGRPTDEATVRQVATDAQQSLRTVLDNALRGLDDSHRQSVDNARTARLQLLGHVEDTLRTVESQLSRHESTQVGHLRADAAKQKQAVQQAADQNVARLDEAISTATADVDTGLAGLVTQLNAVEVPDPATMKPQLASGAEQLDAQLGKLRHAVLEQAGRARDAITQSGHHATTAIAGAAAAAVAVAQHTEQGAAASFAHLGGEATKGLQALAKGHEQAARGAQTATTTAMQQVVTGLSGSYERLNTNFTQGAQHNADAVHQGLTDSVVKDMPGAITTEAQKARDQVKPRWQSVLKWVIIIAIVLVVAIVIAPMVIGAVAGAAAALGASAAAAQVVGMVVGGALVGAATSAATTVVDNAFSGRDLTAGLGKAIALGALGGALGGAAYAFLGPSIQAISSVALRLGAQVAIDVVIDTGINLVTGNFSWQNFGVSLLMSVFMNGVTAHPRVQGIQEGFSSRGFGTGYEIGSSARDAYTGTGGRGSAGPLTIDATHVNVGDTAGAASPYAGTWSGGGGHNPSEIGPRAAGEGFTHTMVTEDPITGVSIDKYQRPMLDSAGNPVIDPATGAPKVKTIDKSTFPDSMGRPEIESAGQRALEQALAGAPNTSVTPPGTGPSGKPVNGTFEAIVITPDGHPIPGEGFYAPAPGGGYEIKSVFPAGNPKAGVIDIAPGSRIVVPGGVVTPPDYGYGSEDEEARRDATAPR